MDANGRLGQMAAGDRATIAGLAEETHTDEAVVQCLYEEEFASLEAHASVKNFIGVIAARRVKERLSAPQKNARGGGARAERRSHAA